MDFRHIICNSVGLIPHFKSLSRFYRDDLSYSRLSFRIQRDCHFGRVYWRRWWFSELGPRSTPKPLDVSQLDLEPWCVICNSSVDDPTKVDPSLKVEVSLWCKDTSDKKGWISSESTHGMETQKYCPCGRRFIRAVFNRSRYVGVTYHYSLSLLVTCKPTWTQFFSVYTFVQIKVLQLRRPSHIDRE